MDDLAPPASAKKLAGALLLLISLVVAAPAAVRLDVFAGHDGILPQASWFPVTIEVFNDGPPFDALVEVAPGQFGGQSRVMALELPTGTLKRFVIPVCAPSFYGGNQWNARILDERGKVRVESSARQVRKQNPRDLPLAAALSRTPPVLPDIKAKNPDLKPLVARLQSSLFPDNPIALEGLDMIYLSSEKAIDLKVPQVNALMAWLQAGGHLVVGVEQIGHFNGADWLKRVLPCDLTGLTAAASHAALQEWLVGRRSFDGTELLLDADPVTTPEPVPAPRPGRRTPPAKQTFENPFAKLKPDETFEEAALQAAAVTLRDGRVLAGSAAQPLIITARRGRGQITLLTFSPELEPFVSWANKPWFWAKMIGVPPALFVVENYNRPFRQSIDGVFGAMIDSKQVRKLPVGWLLLLLVGYLVVIGPLDQIWLKRINRQMLTWITFPVYVALFSVLIYVIGYKLRAGETEWNELHVVDVLPLGDNAGLRGRTFASVYSPVNARYQLASDQPFASLRGEFGGSGGQEVSKVSVEQKGNSFAAEISVPVWTSQLYVSDWWRQGSAPLKLSVTAQGLNWLIKVENNLEIKLTNAILVVSGQVLQLGDLPARETKQFNLAKTGQPLVNFVQSTANNFMGAVNQRQQAFGNDSFRIADVAKSAMAASFVSQMPGAQNQYQPYYAGGFTAPPGFELSPLLARGDAVLLAWAPEYSLIKPMNKFTARRSHRDTLLRLSVPMEK